MQETSDSLDKNQVAKAPAQRRLRWSDSDSEEAFDYEVEEYVPNCSDGGGDDLAQGDQARIASAGAAVTVAALRDNFEYGDRAKIVKSGGHRGRKPRGRK